MSAAQHRGNPGSRPMAARPPSEFEERVVQIDRVARVVKGGRRFRFRATVVIGDGKSRVGLGVAKAGEVQGAIQKAVAAAKKEMISVPLVNDTIPFQTLTTFAGAKLLMKPARPGTGIIAGGAVRPVVELAGITNILSKSLGSDNRINNAKAAIVALKEIAATDRDRLQLSMAAATPKADIERELSKAESVTKETLTTEDKELKQATEEEMPPATAKKEKTAPKAKKAPAKKTAKKTTKK